MTHQIYPPKNFKGQICLSPFVMVRIETSGEVFLCACASWNDQSIGNIFDQPLNEILKSDIAVDVRRTILNGSYTYCNEKTCGVIKNNQLLSLQKLIDDNVFSKTLTDPNNFQMPKEFWLDLDDRCNLSCPSCRNNIIKHDETQLDKLTYYGKFIANRLFANPTTDVIRINTSFTGEVFASPLILEFIRSLSIDSFPNLRWNLQTNGILVPKNWENLGSQSSNVKQLTVTVDGTTRGVYEKLRRGASWDDIQKSLDWISRKKQETDMKIHLRMVVQKDNFEQMEDFYHMAKAYSADIIEYACISNWGTFTDTEFLDIDVYNPKHIEYNKAVDMYKKLKQKQDILFFGNFPD